MQKVLVRFLAIFCLTSLLAFQAFSQTNYNLALVDNPTDGGCTSYNDVWGFEHSNGTEYAILGSTCGTVIYSLSGGGNATKVKTIPGAPSTWRDIKNFGNYVYVIADQGGSSDGLLVINMTNPSAGGITHNFYKPEIDEASSSTGKLFLDRGHNLYIDDEGFIYLAGTAGSQLGNGVGQQRINDGGVLIFNAATNLTNPPFVGKGPAVYAHDVFERDDMMVTSEIYAGKFTLYNLTKSPTSVTAAAQGSQTTGDFFTHNAWTNDDNSVVLTTDERSGSAIESYDISNPNQITKLDSYLPQDNADGNEIPHNVHVMGDFAIASHYSEGVKVINIADPSNLVEVGAYDTHTAESGGSGCWGAYPFLPSGYVLASDRSNGLFVLNPTYVGASYLIGSVTNDAGLDIENAQIEMIAYPYTSSSMTDVDGDYSMGAVNQPITARSAGNIVSVQVSAAGYESQIVDVTLMPDGTVVQDFVLLSAVLPIQVNNFSAVAEGCDHRVSWEVGSIAGHDHFDLQTSLDGIAFQTVKTFFPEDQVSPLRYSSELRNQRSDIQFYRLQQYDLDGTTEFSNILQVTGNCQNKLDAFSVAPNPAFHSLEINSTSPLKHLEIYSTSGNLLRQVNLQTEIFRHQFSIEELSSGIYFVRATTSDGTSVRSFVKT